MAGTKGNSGTGKWVTVPKVPPTDAPDYTEPMPNEGPKQFKCFQLWLQMEEQARTLRAVAQQTAVSPNRLSVYARDYRWADRASKFDQERRLYRMSKRNAKLINTRDDIVRVAADRFTTMLPAELAPSEALRFVEVADKLDRLDTEGISDITREDLENYKTLAIQVIQFLLDGVSDEWAEKARPLLERFESVYGLSDKDPGMSSPEQLSNTW